MGKNLTRIVVGGLGVVLVVLVWLMVTEGIFDGPDALDERAAALEDGALDEPPFAVAEPEVDGDDPEKKPDPDAPSIGLEGTVRIAADDLTIVDKKGRTVLYAKLARTTAKLAAMKHGEFLVPKGLVKGAKVNLYRDAEGQISIASALRTAPPSVRRSLALPPLVEEPEKEKWIMDVGPIDVRNALLTIGFTNKPVKVQINRGVVRVKQGHDDDQPRIYFDEIEGSFLEPSPLPKPVRIAYAKGLVKLSGKPLVDLVARACIGKSELRIHAVVPKKKSRVQITGDSAGLGGALGRMGLKIAGKKKAEKLAYAKGPVKLEEGPGCRDPVTEDPKPE